VAIYHASTKPIARSAGRSAVAAAAYRAGVELVDARTGLVHNYTRKGGVELTEILTPDGIAVERNALWDAAELAEKRKDARTAREWIVALPAELDAGQRRDLARDFARALVERYGVAADLAIHAPDREGDHRNHHAHILTTTRQVSLAADGGLILGAKAHIELSDKARRERNLGSAADEVKAVRELWEHTANAALEWAGIDARIDARSLQAQGIDREATQHLGPVASEMERRGKESDRGDGNRKVSLNNAERARLSAEIIDLQAERERQERQRQAAIEAERKRRAEQERQAAIEAERKRRAEQERQAAIEAERLEREREEEERAQKAIHEPRYGQEVVPTLSDARPRKKTPWREWREATLVQRYGEDVAARAVREDWYIRMRPDLGGLNVVVTGRDGIRREIVDGGDAIRSGTGTAQDISLMLDLAQAKDWKELRIDGDETFRSTAALAAIKRGFALEDRALEARVRQEMEVERQHPRAPDKTQSPAAAPTPRRQPTPEERVDAFFAEVERERQRIQKAAEKALVTIQPKYDALEKQYYATYEMPSAPRMVNGPGMLGWINKVPDPAWVDPEKERERLKKEMRALGLGRTREIANSLDASRRAAYESIEAKDPKRYREMIDLHHKLQREKLDKQIEAQRRRRELEKSKSKGHGIGD
jgi:hypothetical protein